MTVSAKIQEIEASLSSFVAHGGALSNLLNELKTVLGVASAVVTTVAPETGIGEALGAVDTIATAVSDGLNAAEPAAQ